jgi:hypothetical protein
MTQAEGQPNIREKSPPKKQRTELVNLLTDVILSQRRDLIFVISQTPNMDQYMELVGMMGLLTGDESLPPVQQAHLRKMIALELTSFSGQEHAPGLSDFIQVVNDRVGTEISQLAAIPAESKLPVVWGNALVDVASIQAKSDGMDIHAQQ